MIDSDFNTWPLHDAPIEIFLIDWDHKYCQLNLSVFEKMESGAEAVPYKIIWRDIVEVNIPIKNPWGRSVFINSQKMNDENEYIIEMQSGDEIKIIAGKVELIKLE